MCLSSRVEAGGVCPSVVEGGVGQMVGQVLNGSLAGDNGLDEESENGEDGQPSSLELLQLSRGVWVLSQVQCHGFV